MPDVSTTVWLTVLALFAAPSSSIADEARLTSLTGDTRKVDVVSISDTGIVELAEGKVRLDQLRKVETSAKPTNRSARNPINVHLCGAGVLFAESVSIAEEVCVVSGHGFGTEPLRVPIDLVQSIHLQPAKLTRSIIESFRTERDEDQLVLLLDGGTESVNGLIETLSADEVTFIWDDKSRTLPTRDLVAIGVASAGPNLKHRCVVNFSNGSSLAGNVQYLKDNKLSIKCADELSVTVDWKAVQSIQVRSDQLQFLADVKPTSFEHRPIATSKRTWRKDKNISGKPLRLGKRTYANGIGVASCSRLEYQLKQEFKTFCTTIGIDADTEGRGACVFVVRGDGAELARVPMRATDKPRKLKLDINGVRQLELVVEPGADLDLADHANWCDACLLRKQ